MCNFSDTLSAKHIREYPIFFIVQKVGDVFNGRTVSCKYIRSYKSQCQSESNSLHLLYTCTNSFSFSNTLSHPLLPIPPNVLHSMSAECRGVTLNKHTSDPHWTLGGIGGVLRQVNSSRNTATQGSVLFSIVTSWHAYTKDSIICLQKWTTPKTIGLDHDNIIKTSIIISSFE